MVRKKPRILFAYIVTKDMQSFTRNDYNILRKRFKVKPVFYSGKLHGHWSAIRIAKGAFSTDMTFSWFGYMNAYHAVRFSKLFHKKSAVVMGGFDASNELYPEKPLDPRQMRITKYLLKSADLLIAVSEASRRDLLRYTKRKDIAMIYNGIDTSRFVPKGEKVDIIITAGFVSKRNLRKKGLEPFVRTAKYLPHLEFTLIGKPLDEADSYLKSIATSNVRLTGWVSNSELLSYMQKAKVYVQVSSHESFGCSLAEAMACECVPVVTATGAIPEVVGDTGYYVPFGDPKATSEAIEMALQDEKKGREARERVKKMFSLEKREAKLLSAMEELYEN